MGDSILRIIFTNTWIGLHRICWRIYTGDPTAAYDCSTTVNCTSIQEWTEDITIPELDNETCDDIVFEGYVQAMCIDEDSLTGRIPFTSTFEPEPVDCVSYLIRCNTVDISDIDITNVGSKYTPGSPVTITISGGGGTGADLEGVVGNGGIKTWTITSGGTDYNGGATAVFSNVDATTITGTGTGAVFNVTVTAGVITALELVSRENGSGYAVSDTFRFLAADLGGNTGTEATITVDSLNTGEIQDITVNDAGSGFTSIPTAVFDSSPSGITATGIVLMNNCTEFQYDDCSGATSEKVKMELGQSGIMCDNGATGGLLDELPTGYTSVANGCCYSCKTMRFTPDSEVTVYYTDATTGEFTYNTISSQTDINLVEGSYWWMPSSVDVDVVNLGDCT